MKYGIEFPIQEVQFDKSVNFLDLTVYLDEENNFQYHGYTKPTDAKRYLNPTSFHPKTVFSAIPFSQMLRTLRNNSKPETRKPELEMCVKNFVNSGYDPVKLNELKDKAINKFTEHTETINRDEEDKLIFPVHYFDGIKEFKKVLHSLDNEIKSLIGDTRVMLAMKKRSSLGNVVVRNKQLSISQPVSDGQRCNGRGCLQCPLVNSSKVVSINSKPLQIPSSLNCKTKNAIYLWLCKLCDEREAYFGRTIQEVHDRSSGHRGCFNDEGKWDKSALSMHAKDVHQNSFSLNNFTLSVVSKVSPQQLRREEFKFIDKYQTLTFGLNRYKV